MLRPRWPLLSCQTAKHACQPTRQRRIVWKPMSHRYILERLTPEFGYFYSVSGQCQRIYQDRLAKLEIVDTPAIGRESC